jgi:hypothetical protein
MAARPSIALVVAGALASLGAQTRTQNFVVEAPTQAIAERAGQWAEYYRKQKAQEWLGREMAPWPQPCPLRLTVTMNGSGGATSFIFDQGRILERNMHIEGSLDRLIASVLPHEVTHTVFAEHFRQPVPRWADEGGSVLSEDDLERRRHDQLVRDILRSGRQMRLRTLFNLKDYPRDVMVLYAEGYSVTSYLVGLKGRGAFLGFVAHGMRGDWDGAARAYYGFNGVEQLEGAWLQHLRNPQPQGDGMLASRGSGEGEGTHREGEGTHHVMVRQTNPPRQPLLETPEPVARGQIPSEPDPRPEQPAAARPGYLPEYQQRPQPPAMPAPPAVRLGPPQSDSAAPTSAPPSPSASLGPPSYPNMGSPVGYSR